MRKPSVRYWKSRKAYCCWIKGRQQTLAVGPDDAPTGPTYLAAIEQFRQVLSLEQADKAGDSNTLRVVCELWARHMESRRKPDTLSHRKDMLRAFLKKHGGLRVRELTQLVVYSFLDGQRVKDSRPWSDSTCGSFTRCLLAAVNWAVRTKLVRENPIAGIDIPQIRSRSGDVLLTPGQHAEVLANCRGWLRRFVVVLEATGCRPGELSHATAADFNPERGAIVFPADRRSQPGRYRHKTSARGKDRVIFLTGEALEVVKALAAKHPSGPLFLRPNGKPIGRGNLFAAFKVLRERTGLSKLMPYSYRHTFATNWLMSGRSIEILAELLGNTPQTLRLHYSHLCQQSESLRKEMEGFRSQK